MWTGINGVNVQHLHVSGNIF